MDLKGAEDTWEKLKKHPVRTILLVLALCIAITASSFLTEYGKQLGTLIASGDQLDIEGKWDLDRAQALATAEIINYRWHEKDFGEPPYVSKLLDQYSLKYKDRETIVLAVQTTPKDFECHLCAPYLSFFEFEKRPRGWTLSTSRRKTGTF